jgi:hypothetical protein
MPRVTLTDSRTNRKITLDIEADYDNGAFLSVVLADALTQDVILDLVVLDEVEVGMLYDSAFEALYKFLELRG